MDIDSTPYPFAYYRGRATSFARSHRFESSYFGGPGDFLVSGKRYGPSHLHQIVTISNRDLGIPGYRFGFSVPFYYGMCFDGCELTYQRSAHSAIEVTAIEPRRSSSDCPYSGYPPLLPYVPLKVAESVEMHLEQFSESVMQGVEELTDETLILVVPPNPLIGVSMWGPTGDGETVQIIFVYDTENGTTTAYNACT